MAFALKFTQWDKEKTMKKTAILIIFFLISLPFLTFSQTVFRAEKVRQDLRSEKPETRKWAVYEIGLHKRLDWIDVVIDLLENDTYACVRAQAAVTLSRINDPRGIEPLIRAINDKNFLVSVIATNALSFMSHREAEEFLLEALRKKKIDIILSAFDFFIEKGIPGSEDDLIYALRKGVLKEKTSLEIDLSLSLLHAKFCGNQKLKEAAKTYSEKYEITLPDKLPQGCPGATDVPSWGKKGKRNQLSLTWLHCEK